MTRREVLAILAAASAQRASAQAALRFRGLDHIEFTVKDVERSTNFYAQLFGGADVMKNRTTTRRYIKLGASYMAIDKADAPRIDHVCLGVENFNIDEVHAYLTAKGLTYRDYPSGRDTGVNDPDGTPPAFIGRWVDVASRADSFAGAAKRSRDPSAWGVGRSGDRRSEQRGPEALHNPGGHFPGKSVRGRKRTS